VQPHIASAPHVASMPYLNTALSSSPPVDPNAFVQAMSFMATQAGAQSMAAFASHMATATTPPFAHSQPSQTPQHSPRLSPPRHLGSKRKWDERQHTGATRSHFPPQRKPQQQGSKPPRAKAAVAPAIPTFGFSLPTPQYTQSTTPNKGNKSKDNGKGKLRLGLSAQATIQDESSEEEAEDVDEEHELGTKLQGGGFAFEHDGEHISLQTAGDIAEWIKDRRRNFPTYEKALQKAEATAIKRRNELEFVRKLNGKRAQPEVAVVKKEYKPKVQERRKEDEKKQAELAALRKKLHESMMNGKEAPTTVDLGLGYGSATESDDDNSVLSESSVVSSSEESLADSDVESEESDAAPEPVSSKIAPPPINTPPRPQPAQAHMEQKSGKGKVCSSWKQHGKCSYGSSCKFKHPSKEAPARAGLYEKLVEQELFKSDQLALDAIKFLGQNGFLG
jgi:hypothetical protein